MAEYIKPEKDRYIKLSQALEVLDSCACWWVHDRMELIHAADVRPVVYCRDCKYAPSGTDGGEDQGFALEWPHDEWPEDNPCPCKCEDGWYSHKPKPDFFCANGKREET